LTFNPAYGAKGDEFVSVVQQLNRSSAVHRLFKTAILVASYRQLAVWSVSWSAYLGASAVDNAWL